MRMRRKERLKENTVKPLMCPNCGAQVSIDENKCQYCGMNYIVESGTVVLNEVDMKKIEHRENLTRKNLPENVLKTMAPYPQERIMFKVDWRGLLGGSIFLLTNQKMVHFDGAGVRWIVPFESFGGVSWGREPSLLAGLLHTPKFTIKVKDEEKNIWREAGACDLSGIKVLRNIELKTNNAYKLWLMRK